MRDNLNDEWSLKIQFRLVTMRIDGVCEGNCCKNEIIIFARRILATEFAKVLKDVNDDEATNIKLHCEPDKEV